MTTEKLLKHMAEQAFGSTYQKEIRDIFQRDVDAGILDISEREYREAMAILPKLLPEEKMVMLAKYEDVCKDIREYSANYGFLAGMYCGFLQYFTEDHSNDGGFQMYVLDDMAMMPKMCRHIRNYENIQQRNEIGLALNEGESKYTQEHIVSVECAWSQRAHSASLNGFYCGYRAALAITDKVSPMGSVRSHGKLVTMEHWLGYTKPCTETEVLRGKGEDTRVECNSASL